ncbi:MAG: sugar transferase, partial [Bacteroidota bacterium]
MDSSRRIDNWVYSVFDYLMAVLSWACFFLYRKRIENIELSSDILQDEKFIYGILVIPIGWILLYSIFDEYRDIYRKSRLATLARTFFLTFLGVFFLFFTLILDDFVIGYQSYITSFIVLFSLHFMFTSVARMIILTRASRRLKAGIVTFNTLIIGGNENAVELYQEIANREKGLGYHFLGFIDTNGRGTNELAVHLPQLGKIADIDRVVRSYGIEEVIIAIETSEHNRLREILNVLFDFEERVLVKIIPDMYDILLGNVQMNHIYGAVLIEIRQELMPRWQKLIKRFIDLVASFVMLVLLLPLYLYIALRVQLSSEGPIFFRQERIGQYGKPFWIYKFRSMYTNAEAQGPQLSSDHDPRCTPWGAVMRKWR